jgi:hypothetical protein
LSLVCFFLLLCMTVSLMPCHAMLCQSRMVGHPFAGGGQLLPGPTIALGLFLQLTAAPYG